MKNTIFGVLTVVVIVGVVLLLNLGTAAKYAIETAGTQALGTPVHIGSMKVSLADKTASLNDLSVANPKGFKSGNLLKTKGISTTVSDVTDKLVMINDVTVDGMTVTYEVGANGTNFGLIQKRMASAPAKPVPAANGKKENRKVVIQRLKITNAQLIPVIGGAQPAIALPDMTLTNVGTANNPATIAQVSTQVLNKVIATSTTAIAKAGLNTPVNDAINKAKENLKGMFK